MFFIIPGAPRGSILPLDRNTNESDQLHYGADCECKSDANPIDHRHDETGASSSEEASGKVQTSASSGTFVGKDINEVCHDDGLRGNCCPASDESRDNRNSDVHLVGVLDCPPKQKDRESLEKGEDGNQS